MRIKREMGEPLLRVRELNICHRSSASCPLEQVSFDLERGDAIGVLGESGAGKTTLARALMRLLPARDWITGGSIQLKGVELVGAPERELERIRGRQMTLISQEPELALNPVLSAGRQVAEVLRAHFPLSAKQRRDETERLLATVGLSDRRFYSAPMRQLSGGERQRVVIAQVLAAKPALLILDEPTSALDTITQAEILQLIKKLKASFGLSLLFITHNPALLAGFTKRALLISGGRASEVNPFEHAAATL